MNPYSQLPDYAFWRRSVAGLRPEDVDPVISVPFKITPSDKVATAGSCFAQRIARTLVAQGFNYQVVENAPPPGEPDENYGTFSARYGNIYTVRQLRQLAERAYGLFVPEVGAWQREDGRYVDPFRSQIQTEGFATQEALVADRERHLAAVREMMETCDVFIFTLGMTEAWVCEADGAIVPTAPGVVKAPMEGYSFYNATVQEAEADLAQFLKDLRAVNSGVRIILTVSPVPLIATFDEQHVLSSNTYSKAVLRVTAETMTRQIPDVSYFPSYEIITGHHARYSGYASDLRTISDDSLDHVMLIFTRHYLSETSTTPLMSRGKTETNERRSSAAPAQPTVQPNAFDRFGDVICDEEAIEE